MRRTLPLLTLIAAFAVPQAALARHGERDDDDRDDRDDRWTAPRDAQPQRHEECRRVQRRSGTITVHNPNHRALQVLIDGVPSGRVPPRDRAEFGPFQLGRYQVETRFLRPRRGVEVPVGQQSVVVRGPGGAQITAPYAQEGILAFDNPWQEPLSVFVDGERVGMVPVHQPLVTVIPTGSWIEVRAPGGTVVLRQRSRLAGLERQKIPLTVPAFAWVEIQNPASVPLALLDATTGQRLGSLRPGQRERLQVSSGRRSLRATFQGRVVDTIDLLASPFRTNRWTIVLPRVGEITVENANRLAARLLLDGRSIGWLEPGERRVVSGVRLGRVEVTLEVQRGYRSIRASRLVQVTPLLAPTVSPRIALSDGRRAARSGSRGRHHRRGWGSRVARR